MARKSKHTALALGLLLGMAACTGDNNNGKAQHPHGADTTAQQAQLPPADPHSLRAKLEAKKADFLAKASPEKIAAYQYAIDSIERSGLIERAKRTGDKAPDFVLINAAGTEVRLKEQLKKGPVVLTWYRGGWCPYCNLTMHELQERLPEIQGQGAQLLALTPELPDKSLSTKEKNALEFEVLSDTGNRVAEQYGIVFKLTPKVAEYYKESFNLQEYNGISSNELPLAATYIIDPNGVIRWTFLDADYRRRAEPDDIIGQLEQMNSKPEKKESGRKETK